MKKSLVLFLLVLLLSGCVSYSRTNPVAFQATLDSIVTATMVAAPQEDTPTPTTIPTQTPLPTSTPVPPTATPTSNPPTREEATVSTPVPETDTVITSPATEQLVMACLTKMNALNVRELPEFDALRVDILEKMECAELVAMSEDQLWGKVKESGGVKEGWVPLEFLDLLSKLDKLPGFKK